MKRRQSAGQKRPRGSCGATVTVRPQPGPCPMCRRDVDEWFLAACSDLGCPWGGEAFCRHCASIYAEKLLAARW